MLYSIITLPLFHPLQPLLSLLYNDHASQKFSLSRTRIVVLLEPI